jgi:hypothetical protein
MVDGDANLGFLVHGGLTSNQAAPVVNFVMTRNKMTNSRVHSLTVELCTIDILDEY